MLGKIVGAVVGERMARRMKGMNGVGGAILGAGAGSVIRRLGPVGLIAAGIGAYALKRHQERAAAQEEALAPQGNKPAGTPQKD